MVVLRTKDATHWPEQRGGWPTRLINAISKNPGYTASMHLIDSWLVEFDDEGLPGREIALDKGGNVLFSGPDDQNYGFWLDTNMTLQDFDGEAYDAGAFETLWRTSRR